MPRVRPEAASKYENRGRGPISALRPKGFYSGKAHAIERTISSSRDAKGGEINFDLLDRLFDEDLDPADHFWIKIGYGQNHLIALLLNGKMPIGVTFSALVSGVNGVAVV